MSADRLESLVVSLVWGGCAGLAAWFIGAPNINIDHWWAIPAGLLIAIGKFVYDLPDAGTPWSPLPDDSSDDSGCL